ncbi:MAG TPA: hypothetical protein VIK33_14280 [Anaerolineae bacterium]
MPKRRPKETAHCAEHDCPMLRIDDEYVCILEYVDEHLGGKQVRDLVVVEDGLITLLFDDDHELPLLCPHCGDPIDVDEDELLNEIAGLYLVALQYVPADAGTENYESVEFLFASDPDADIDDIPDNVDVQSLLLHPDSARELVCPGQ